MSLSIRSLSSRKSCFALTVAKPISTQLSDCCCSSGGSATTTNLILNKSIEDNHLICIK